AGEDAGEGGGLEQDEHELERRVADRELEAGHVVHARQSAGERREEEQRKDEPGDEKRGRGEVVVKHPPGHGARDGQDRPHVRAILPRSASDDSLSPTIDSAIAIPKPSASASPFQPSITRLLIAPIRKETGFSDAAPRNTPVSIRFRGRFIDEMNRKTKKSGKRLCTASVEPVRSAARAPKDPKAKTIRTASTKITNTPAAPDSNLTPMTSPTVRYHSAWSPPIPITPPRCPASNAALCIGVSASRLRKPVWMSRARSTPALTVAKSAPWMNGKARKKATNDSLGKPGRLVAAWRPPVFTAIRASGKISGKIQFAGWRRIRMSDRRPRKKICQARPLLAPVPLPFA